MSRIVPAILTDSVAELRQMVSAAGSFADFVQMDMMDGVFVPSRSIDVDSLARLEMRFRWEAHLMVDRPSTYVERLAAAGAERVTIHLEAREDIAGAIALARRYGMKVGLALNPGTAARELSPFVSLIDLVLLLTVEPGYYGSPFLPEVLPKVAEVRALLPSVEVAVDGGIKERNVRDVALTGVDEICVGSAIFRDPAPAEAFRRLQHLALSV